MVLFSFSWASWCLLNFCLLKHIQSNGFATELKWERWNKPCNCVTAALRRCLQLWLLPHRGLGGSLWGKHVFHRDSDFYQIICARLKPEMSATFRCFTGNVAVFTSRLFNVIHEELQLVCLFKEKSGLSSLWGESMSPRPIRQKRPRLWWRWGLSAGAWSVCDRVGGVGWGQQHKHIYRQP